MSSDKKPVTKYVVAGSCLLLQLIIFICMPATLLCVILYLKRLIPVNRLCCLSTVVVLRPWLGVTSVDGRQRAPIAVLG